MADYTYDFSSQSTSNPWTPSAPIKKSSSGNLQLVASSGVKSASGGSVTYGCHDVNYTLGSTQIRAEIDIGAVVFASDRVGPAIIARSGANAGAGYAALPDNYGGIYVYKVSAAGALTQIGYIGSITLAVNDLIGLGYQQSTNTLTVYQNGTSRTTVTDSTYNADTTLGAGWLTDPQNANAQYVKRLLTTGVASSAATLSGPTPAGTIGTATTATIGATTDQASGTAYTILSTVQTDVTTATDANVIAGQKAGGATTINNNAAVSSTTISIPVTGLTAGTTYYASTIQVNSNGNSTRANTSFTTAAAAPSSAFNFDCASTGVAATTFAADAGASRVVVAVLSHEQTNGTRPVASLVVGGATFQKLTDAIFGQGTSYAYTEIWYCLESSIASIGANPSVTVTATSTGNKFVSGTLFTIANVQQSAASWVQGVDAKAIGTDLSATLATVIGRQIVGGATATIGGNAFTTGASVTEITGSDRNFNSSASRAVSFYGVASGTSTTVTTGNTNSNTAMSQSMVAVAFPALSGRSIGITLRDAGAVGQPVLNNQTRKFWTRSTLDGAVVDGGSSGISITCGTDGVFILSGLTIAAGAGYLTMADPADPSKSHNFFVTYV